MTIRVTTDTYSLVHHMLAAAWTGAIAPLSDASWRIEAAARSGVAFVGYGPTVPFVRKDGASC